MYLLVGLVVNATQMVFFLYFLCSGSFGHAVRRMLVTSVVGITAYLWKEKEIV